MADFKGVSEKFSMRLANYDGHSDRVSVQIGMEGLKLVNPSDNRVMRSYDLSHISRWQSRGGSLVLYTRTPVDVEERQTTLTADDNTVRNALDTLTCCCMQLAELLQSRQTETAQETANNLHALVAGGGKKKTPLPSADEVEYWRSPDKAGWLQSQGEHLKNWRNRWFVLKQGHLFRFFTDKVSESVKPRGVVDLSKIQDVKVLPGRANTIQLKTASGGAVCYIANSETEVVEWVSAIEGAMQKIARHIAGVEEEAAPAAAKPKAGAGGAGGGAASNPTDWLRQLERNMAQSGGGGGGGSGSAGRGAAASSSGRGNNLSSTMVNVVGYDAIGGGGGGSGGAGGGGGGGGYRDPYRDHMAAARDTSPYATLNKQYSGGYTPIQSSAVAGAQSLSSDLDLNYGGGGGSSGRLTPQTSYGQQTQAPQQQPTYGQAPSYGQPQPQQQQYYQPQAQPQPGPYGMPQAQQPAVNGNGGGGMPYGAPAAAAPYGQAPYYQQPVQQPAAAAPQGVSLMDAVPQQAPAYPFFQQGPGQGQPAPQQQQHMQAHQAPLAPQGGWQVHHTGEGRPYYYHAASGVTQWEPPAGFA